MSAKITFFPVGDGDMTLVTTGLRKHFKLGSAGQAGEVVGRRRRYRVADSGRLARRLEHRVEHGESSWRSST